MAKASAEGLHVRRIPGTEIASFLQRHPELQSGMLYPGFFCTASWLAVVLRHVRPENCFGLVVSRNEAPIALLPLEPVRNWMGGTDLRYLGHRYHPDPLGLICDGGDLPFAVAAIRKYLETWRGWDRLILDNFLEGESVLWSGASIRQSVAPYLLLPCSFEELLASFPGKKRYKVRSKISKAKDFGLELRFANTPEERIQFLGALFHLHGLRSDAISRNSSIRASEVQELHRDLVASDPRARLQALKKDERFVAVLYGFEEQETFHFYQIAHDPEFEAIRPGTVLLSHSIDAACKSRVKEFNFLQGDEPYKFEWTNAVRMLMQVELSAPRLRSKLVILASRSRRLAKQFLRDAMQFVGYGPRRP